METEFDALLDALPFPAVLLEQGLPRRYNRRARELLPDCAPGRMPAPLAGVLSACREEGELAGALWLEGRCYGLTLSPAGEGRQLLCLALREEGAALPLDAVATQLRQLLADLHLSTQQLGRVLRPLDDPGADRLYHVLHQGTYRLLRMARHLEAADQLAQGRAGMEPLDLADLCAALAGEAEVLTRGMGIQLEYETPLLTLPVLGSGSLLQMLVLNLLSNAIRGARGGGRVLLRLTRESGRAVITVENSGSCPADLSALFRPGQAAPVPGGGLGLGMLLVERIAALHQGSVLAMDTGAGVRVTAALPLGTVDRDLPLRTPGLEGEGGFSTVLVELSDVLPGDCFDYFDQL